MFALRTAGAVAIVLLLCSIHVASGQSGTCEVIDTSLSQCAALLGPSYSVFVPEGKTQAELHENVLSLVRILTLDLFPEQCTNAAWSFACGTYLQQCTTVDTPQGSVQVPAPACRSNCQTFQAACGPILTILGREPTPCNSANPQIPTIPLWPESTFQYPSLPIDIQCHDVEAVGAVNQLPLSALIPGTCQPFTGAPLSQCGSVIEAGTSVFVPTDLSLEALDETAQSRLGAFLLGVAPTPCRTAAFEFVCSAVFRECVDVPLPNFNTEISLPSAPCLGKCSTFVDQCDSTFGKLGVDAPSCDDFGEEVSVITVVPNAIEFEVPCTSAVQTSEVRAIPHAQCIVTTPQSFPSSQCQAVVDYPVYVPEGLTLNDLDAAAAMATQAVRLGLVTNACRAASMPFICASAFRPCSFSPVPRPPEAPPLEVLLAGPPCRGTCDNFVDACGTVPVFQANLPDCSAQNERLGVPEFPSESFSFDFGPLTFTVECNQNNQIIADFNFLPSGKCIPMEKTEYSQCNAVIEEGTPIFLPEGQTFGQLDFNALNRLYPLGWLSTPDDCSAAAVRFICPSIMVGCVSIPVSPIANVSIPAPPCKELCYEFGFYCGDTVRGGGNDLPDCEAIPNPPALPIAPELACVYTTTEVELYRECPPNMGENNDDDSYDDMPCVFGCPRPIFTPTQYDIILGVDLTLGWAGMILAFITWLSFMIHPIKRKYPLSNPGWNCFYVGCLAFARTIPTYTGGWEGSMCINGAPSPRRGWYCILHSFFHYLGFWGLMLWYNFVGLSLFITVFKIKAPPDWVMVIAYHSITWIGCLGWWATMVATDSITNLGVAGCGVDSARWNEWFQDLAFFGPFTLLSISATIMLGSVFLYTVFVLKWKGLILHWRILAYLSVGILFMTYSNAYHFLFRIREDTRLRIIAEWLQCGGRNVDYERCDRDLLIYFTPYLLIRIFVGMTPTCFFFILMSDPTFYQYFVYAFKKYILRRDLPPFALSQNRVGGLSSKLQHSSGGTHNSSDSSIKSGDGGNDW